MSTTVMRRLAWLAAGAVLALLLPGATPLHALPFLMGPTTTIADNMEAVLKVVFNEPLVMNVVTDSELLGVFETDTRVQEDQTTGGRYVETAHYFSLPAGVGARLENDYVPEADAPQFVNSRLYLKKVQGTIEMSGDTMRRVRSSAGAYVDYLERALPDLVTRLTNEMDRMALGYGAGVKARVAAKSAYDTPVAGQFQITVDRALGLTGWLDAWLQFLRGERNVFTGSLTPPITLRNPGTAQSARLVNVNEQTSVLTYAGSSALHAAIQVNDFIAAGDNAGASLPAGNPAVLKEIGGLVGGVDDGAILAVYLNIARANEDLWQGIMIDGSAAPFDGALSEELLTYADDETAVRGGGKVNLIVTSRSGMRSYWKSLKGDRFFLDPRAYFGGKEGLSIILADRTLGLKVGRKVPANVTFGLQTDTWRRFSLNSWMWDDQTGSIWNRVTDATGRRDAFYATGLMYEEMACFMPHKNFRINNLARVS